MLSAAPRKIFAAALFLILISPAAFAVTPQETMEQLKKIEEHLNAIDKQQAAILEQQQEILKKLDVVKIWARRS